MSKSLVRTSPLRMLAVLVCLSGCGPTVVDDALTKLENTVAQLADSEGLAVPFANAPRLTPDPDILDHPLSDYGWRLDHWTGVQQAIADWHLASQDKPVNVRGIGRGIGHILWRADRESGRWEAVYGAPLTLRKLLEGQWPLDPPVEPDPPAGRASDPPVGQLLPFPQMGVIVADVAAEFPRLLENSCQDEDGTWAFLDLVVDRLRLVDTRWGYNCKRGNCDDPSQDVAAYHAGAGPEVEGVFETRTVDVIAGHCGPDPSANWDVHPYGTGPDAARWTSRGRF